MSRIGFIGTGWVGSTYKKNFESRGYKTIAYSLDPEYVGNKDRIKDCDIVIIAVPTPTVDGVQDTSILESVIPLVGSGKIAVIKSTILPGTTDKIQMDNDNVWVLHMPEFLSEKSAEYDAMNPSRNIIGLPVGKVPEDMYNRDFEIANEILDVFPEAPYTTICTAKEAELIKYAHNCFGVLTVVWHNLLYNVCEKEAIDWEVIKDAIKNDKDNVVSYLNPINKGGRGAGGDCFIKDFAAFSEFYRNISETHPFLSGYGKDMLASTEMQNLDLLLNSNKDLEIVKEVYPDIYESYKG